MRPLLFACLFVAGLAASPAFAIKGGMVSADPNGLRRNVVQIRGPGGTQCSGTVIAQRLVLTAAHCFLAGRGNYLIRVLDPKFHFRVAVASQVAIHPNFDVAALGTNAPLNDIALLRADRDFPAWIVPAPLAARDAKDATSLASLLHSGSAGSDFVDVVAAGYGMSRDRTVSTAGTLREMHFAMVDQVDDPSKLLFLIDRRGRAKRLSAGVCRGDSGGPVFRHTANGYVQVGVISAVIAGRNTDCGAVTAVTAITAYRDFIGQMAARIGTPVHFR